MRNMLRERTKARIEELGLNAFKAAELAGLNRYIIHDLLIGKKDTIRQAAIIKIASALDCDPEYLAGTQAEIRRQAA